MVIRDNMIKVRKSPQGKRPDVVLRYCGVRGKKEKLLFFILILIMEFLQ